MVQFSQGRRGPDPYSLFQETVSRSLHYVPNQDWQGKPLVGLGWNDPVNDCAY